ncbi:MAG: DUF1934 domain-containing protein [Lachnospiraceae bacterium]|nr:DUF1934 domain-containing protein [Lachnospiraceae bacterium]
MMSTKQVTVRVTGNQFYFHYTDTNEEPIEVISAGTMRREKDSCVVEYEEAYEGIEEKTKNTVTIGPGRVQIDKTGVVTSSLIFELGKKSSSYYSTPFGMMEMGVTTTSLKTDIRENEADVYIAYALIMNGSYVADCTVDIAVRETEAEE